MDQYATWYGGRPRPRRHCVRWGSTFPSPKRGDRGPPPQFSAHVTYGTQLPLSKRGRPHPRFSAHVSCGQTAGWMKTPLGMEVDLGPGHIVLDGVPALSERGTAPPPSFRPMCNVATVAHLSYWWALVLTCHRGTSAGGKYRSASKLLIDIRMATGHWPFLMCWKLAHVVHSSRCDMLPGLHGHAVCITHCRSVCSVPFPSRLITMHTSTTAVIAN